MAPSKNSYNISKGKDDIEMTPSKPSKLQYSYEEALEITGKSTI